jgi:hypothetical protein
MKTVCASYLATVMLLGSAIWPPSINSTVAKYWVPSKRTNKRAAQAWRAYTSATVETLLRALGLRQHSPLIHQAAQIDFIVSLMVLIGAVVFAIPITVRLLAAVWQRRWPRAQQYAFWWIVLVLVAVYCLASVLNGLDTLDLLPE